MSYQSGFRHEIIIPLNRSTAKAGKFGLDSSGIEWEEGDPLHANVDFQRGKSALNAGAVDAYAVKIVRMNWTDKLNERSRVLYDGKVYQIIPETFNGHYRENTLQFLMQLLVNAEYKRKQKPYFTTVNDAGYTLAYVGMYGDTVLVGSGTDAVSVSDPQESEFIVSFGDQVIPLNPDGCTDQSIGTDIGMSMTDGSLEMADAPEGYDVDSHFSVGKVIACSTVETFSEMVCEILYKGKAVEGWYFLIPQSSTPTVASIRNYIS